IFTVFQGAGYGIDRTLFAGSKVRASRAPARRHHQGAARQHPFSNRGEGGGAWTPTERGRAGRAAKEAGDPHAPSQPLSQAAAHDWSDYVSHLLEGIESLAGPR